MGFLHGIVIALLQLVLAVWSCEDGNCTAEPDVSVEQIEIVRSGNGNLAWLVTPALFGLGVIFLIYKCCKDGLCNCRRLRRRAVMEYHREHGYIPLSQVVLHTTATSGQGPTATVPGGTPGQGSDLPPGLRRHLVVIHNQTFCITLRDTPNSCPGAAQCLHADQPHICVQQRPGQPPQATIVGPPTYEEAIQNQEQAEGERPPRYSEVEGEGLPASGDSVSEAGEAREDGNEPTKLPDLLPAPQRQVRFDTRRRHFSAQDRRILESLLTDGEGTAEDSLRQRCFSFNALRDAFRRGSSQERQILLQRETTTQVFTADDDSVFLSVELIGPDGETSGGQPMSLPDDVTIVNDIDTIEVLSAADFVEHRRRLSIQERQRHGSGPACARVRAATRQRHASAPDPSRSKTNKHN